MFNVARKKWKWTWIRENPVSGLGISVGKSNWRYRWLSLEEETALLDACGEGPAWLKPLVVFALQTGMRRGEILNLTWPDVDVRARFIQIRHSKNGEPRSIPMSEILLATVAAMKVRPLSGKVFQVGINGLRSAFERAVKAAGIEDFHFHDLRHTFASRCVQYGVDLYRVQKLLGHKGPEMTQRYAHHVRESITPAIQALDAFYRESAGRYKSVTSGENGEDSKG
jgi:integrase